MMTSEDTHEPERTRRSPQHTPVLRVRGWSRPRRHWLEAAIVVYYLAACLSSLMFAQRPVDEFQTELEQGKQDAEQGKYADAAKHFNKANELRQGNCSECYVWLARMDIGAGSLQQALMKTAKAVATATTPWSGPAPSYIVEWFWPGKVALPRLKKPSRLPPQLTLLVWNAASILVSFC
ncbi:MAG TPA: hypothetical protein VI636_21975 [Candidatus Angelobacter sp.]